MGFSFTLRYGHWFYVPMCVCVHIHTLLFVCVYVIMGSLVTLVCVWATLILTLLLYCAVCACSHFASYSSLALERQIAPLPFASMLSALQGMSANWLTPLMLLITISLFRYIYRRAHTHTSAYVCLLTCTQTDFTYIPI